VRRMNAYSQTNDRTRLSPAPARRRPHSDGVFTPADMAELSVPQPAGRPSSMVEQVRELAKEARRQARLESSSLTRGHFETPQSYRDDTDDHTLIAAPAPSVSPIALGVRIDYVQPPSRTISRLDHDECEELSFSGQIYVLSHLIFFSILGTAARIGMDRLVSYPGAPSVIPVLWPNFAASFILGLVLEERTLSVESNDLDGRSNTLEKARLVHLQSDLNTPLYVGLTAGFCSCLDSYAAVMLDAFLALANNLPTPINHPYPSAALPSTFSTVHRNAGYSLAALLAVLILNICLSLSALKCGAQLAHFLHGRLPTFSIRVTWALNRLMVPLATLTWIGMIVMAVFPPDRPGGPDGKPLWALETWRGTALFALIFAPLGCIIRYFLGKHLNAVSEGFPLGSFCANVFGTVVLGMAYDLQHTPLGQGVSSGIGGGLVGCQVLQGVIDGFCGGLTTVAALSAEVIRLERRGWIYGVSTLAGAGALMLVVMGPVKWTIGFGEPVCAVFTS
jgi:fluoride exporter